MKIVMKYEADSTCKPPVEVEIEVPDNECVNFIEADYRERLVSGDEQSITRRGVQEIMDDRFNYPLYNRWHKELSLSVIK